MTSFYIKTDLSVAGPFTGIEIREAALAGIIRPQSYLSHFEQGPWVTASQAKLFSDKGAPLPHPPGTPVPTFQTRGMPGAFMGPFKLRELIGLACQGMMPPGTELQSDPTLPWISISDTGILPACLHGDLVRIDAAGKRILRTVIPADLGARREQLKTLLSPIERAKSLRVAGATAAPLASDAVKFRNQRSPGADEPVIEESNARSGELGSQSIASSVHARQAAFNFGAAPDMTHANEKSKCKPRRSGGSSLLNRVRTGFHERIGKRVRPQIALAAMLLLVALIGLPVGYSAYRNMPIPQQNIVGNWVGIPSDSSETAVPGFAVRFTENGQCVLMNRTGSSWSGDFQWSDPDNPSLGFQPEGELAVQFDSAERGHDEGLVVRSDGHLRLSGFVKDAPRLDGHPVRDLFVRRRGDRLSVGYATSARWVNGERQLQAAWVHTRAVPPSAVSIADTLRDQPDEMSRDGVAPNNAVAICRAIEAAEIGREFEHKGIRTFRNGCYTFSSQVDTGFLLNRFGAADEARTLQEFEKPHDLNEPSLEDVIMLRYGEIDFIVRPDGEIIYLATRSSASASQRRLVSHRP